MKLNAIGERERKKKYIIYTCIINAGKADLSAEQVPCPRVVTLRFLYLE